MTDEILKIDVELIASRMFLGMLGGLLQSCITKGRWKRIMIQDNLHRLLLEKMVATWRLPLGQRKLLQKKLPLLLLGMLSFGLHYLR